MEQASKKGKKTDLKQITGVKDFSRRFGLLAKKDPALSGYLSKKLLENLTIPKEAGNVVSETLPKKRILNTIARTVSEKIKEIEKDKKLKDSLFSTLDGVGLGFVKKVITLYLKNKNVIETAKKMGKDLSLNQLATSIFIITNDYIETARAIYNGTDASLSETARAVYYGARAGRIETAEAIYRGTGADYVQTAHAIYNGTDSNNSETARAIYYGTLANLVDTAEATFYGTMAADHDQTGIALHIGTGAGFDEAYEAAAAVKIPEKREDKKIIEPKPPDKKPEQEKRKEPTLEEVLSAIKKIEK